MTNNLTVSPFTPFMLYALITSGLLMEDSTFFLEEIAIIAYSSIKQSVLG